MLSIRPYLSSDFARVADIYLEAKQDELDFEDCAIEVIPLAQDEDRYPKFLASNLFVCYEDKKILGFCGYKNDFICWVYVDKSARGLGVGKLMMSFLLQEIAGTVSLQVTCANKVARSLYSQMGFMPKEQMTVDYNRTDVLVERFELFRKTV